MTRPRVYLDECVVLEVAPLLASRGFDALTARAAGMLSAPDPEQLAYATAHDRLLVTFDVRDFRRLHHAGIAHAGMLLMPTSSVQILEIRLSLAVDWIAAQPEYRNRLFRWKDVQGRLIAGERAPGYTAEEVSLALGQSA